MKILIAQGGGPTMVINQSLVGAVLEAKKNNLNIIGARYGIKGIVKEDFVPLHTIDHAKLSMIANTPGSALFSTRDKPDEEYCKNILKVFQKHDIRGFFYIGGNDSSETINIILEAAKCDGYEMKGFHIPKTVDNDLVENDHTPGFPSAARYVTKAVMGIERDNASLPGIHLVIIMGRHAGFLTCAAALGGAHRVYIPEHPFDVAEFAQEVKTTSEKEGRALVAISEGIEDKNRNPIIAQLMNLTERDQYGNLHLSGLPLGDLLAMDLKKRLGNIKVRGDNFGYPQRCYPDPSPVDVKEAKAVGKKAIEYFLKKNIHSGSITITRISNTPYKSQIGLVDLGKVSGKTRQLPKEYYDPVSKTVTKAGFDYLRPLVGDLPMIEKLS